MEFHRRLPMKWRVAAAFVAVGAIWGSAWIPTSALPQTLPALAAGALRFALAAIFLAIAAILAGVKRRSGKRQPIARLLAPSAVLGVTMLGLPYALTAWAAGRVSAGVVAVCFALMPLLALLFEDALFSDLFLAGDARRGEEPGGAIPAVVLGVGGVAMVVAPGLSFHWQQAGGVAALLAAMVLGAFSLIYARGLWARGLWARGRLAGGDIMSFSAIQMGVASVFLAALLMVSGLGKTVHWQETAALPLALLAIVVSGGTLPLLFWLLSRITAWQAATLQWASTLVAVSEAAWVLRAKPAAEAWIGAALIPACLAWIFMHAQSGDSRAVTLEITEHTFPPVKASESSGKSG
jgi:drug/metabolite transporter (DMT)-like permease